MEKDEQTFLNAVIELYSGGDSLTAAIYHCIDLMTSQLSKNMACRKGCGQCCHQAILISQADWNEISRFLNDMPVAQESAIASNIARSIDQWDKALVSGAHLRDRLGLPSLKLTAKLLGRPCPFLQDGSCVIYQVRPLDCRVHFAKKRCVKPGQSGCPAPMDKYVRLSSDIIQGKHGMTALSDPTHYPMQHFIKQSRWWRRLRESHKAAVKR